jgi:hypothetical protein
VRNKDVFLLHLGLGRTMNNLTWDNTAMLQTIMSLLFAITHWLRLKMSEASDNGRDWLLGTVLG